MILAIGTTIAAWIFHNQRDENRKQRDQIRQALVEARNSEARAIEARTDANLRLLDALQSRAVPGGSASGSDSGSRAWTPWNRRPRSPGS